eukprot:gene23110-biopygen13345
MTLVPRISQTIPWVPWISWKDRIGCGSGQPDQPARPTWLVLPGCPGWRAGLTSHSPRVAVVLRRFRHRSTLGDRDRDDRNVFCPSIHVHLQGTPLVQDSSGLGVHFLIRWGGGAPVSVLPCPVVSLRFREMPGIPYVRIHEVPCDFGGFRSVLEKSAQICGTTGYPVRLRRTRTGRGPDAGRTIEFEETDADRTRTGRVCGRFSLDLVYDNFGGSRSKRAIGGGGFTGWACAGGGGGWRGGVTPDTPLKVRNTGCPE